MEKKLPNESLVTRSFSSRGRRTQADCQTPHQCLEEAEQLRLSSPHHTVGSCGLSSRSFSRRFFLQNLTATTMQRRTRITAQDTPTASARILISDMVTVKKHNPEQLSAFSTERSAKLTVPNRTRRKMSCLLPESVCSVNCICTENTVYNAFGNLQWQ